jgi:hypothetical protein
MCEIWHGGQSRLTGLEALSKQRGYAMPLVLVYDMCPCCRFAGAIEKGQIHKVERLISIHRLDIYEKFHSKENTLPIFHGQRAIQPLFIVVQCLQQDFQALPSSCHPATGLCVYFNGFT